MSTAEPTETLSLKKPNFVEEVFSSGILTLITVIVIGILLVIYYSLGLPFLFVFIFLLYLFVVRGISLSVQFRKFE